MGRAPHLRRGRDAEDHALDWLRRRGLTLIERNVRCRFGEIDLVMNDSGTTVFVEVRCRPAGNRVSARDSIDARKQHKLALAAAWYLGRHRERAACPARFDVVAIDGQPGGRSALQWLPDAFRPGG